MLENEGFNAGGFRIKEGLRQVQRCGLLRWVTWLRRKLFMGRWVADTQARTEGQTKLGWLNQQAVEIVYPRSAQCKHWTVSGKCSRLHTPTFQSLPQFWTTVPRKLALRDDLGPKDRGPFLCFCFFFFCFGAMELRLALRTTNALSTI